LSRWRRPIRSRRSERGDSLRSQKGAQGCTLSETWGGPAAYSERLLDKATDEGGPGIHAGTVQRSRIPSRPFAQLRFTAWNTQLAKAEMSKFRVLPSSAHRGPAGELPLLAHRPIKKCREGKLPFSLSEPNHGQPRR